jgi:hypothetical protein
MVAVLNVEPMNHFLDQLCIWHKFMLLLLSKGYYRNTACTLNYISTLLLIKQISWFYWWRRHAVNFLVSCLYLPWFCSTWFTCVVNMLSTSSFLVKNSTSRTIICKFSAIVAPCEDSTLRGGVTSVISTLTFDQTCWIHTILRLFARSVWQTFPPCTPYTRHVRMYLFYDCWYVYRLSTLHSLDGYSDNVYNHNYML